MEAIIRNSLLALAIFACVHGSNGQVMPVPQSATQPQTKQTVPFGFGDLRLGMSIAEFKAKHPAPKPSDPGAKFYLSYGRLVQSPGAGQADCSTMQEGPELRLVAGVRSCSYYGDSLGVSFEARPLFVDGKLAMITVVLPSAVVDAGPGLRHEHPSFLSELSSGFGQPKQFGNPEIWNVISQFYGLRWENDSSVAEYQDAWCFPLNREPRLDLGKEIAELFEGSYCGDASDQDNPRQPVILFLHKELGKALMVRLANSAH
jgi:hypothetical protein